MAATFVYIILALLCVCMAGFSLWMLIDTIIEGNRRYEEERNHDHSLR